jgi:hypothetical protein
MRLDIRLHVAHILGKENMVVDALSRMEVTGDYALKPGKFHQALQLLEAHSTADLFAHALNRKLDRFMVMDGFLALGAVATDAFTFSWKKELPYAFPPIQLIGRMLQRVREERITAVVVMPKWTSEPWWNLFRDMQRMTIELGQSKEALSPGLAMTGSHVTLTLPPGLFLMALITGETS